MSWLKLLAVTALCCSALAFNGKGLEVVQQWKTVEFIFPNEAAKERATELKYYVPGASVTNDVDVHYWMDGTLDRIFVTLPRPQPGRPVTLGTVEDDGKIRGYPDYATNDNQGHNCDGITSVFRIAIDKCHRLWVLDTGKVGATQSCPPQLLAYDLITDELIFRYQIPDDQVKSSSLFATPIVDMGTNCRGFRDVYVYAADVSSRALVVVDVENESSWRITNELFKPEKDFYNLTVAGESVHVMDGLFGMALSPYEPNQDRTLFFHALSSTAENYVKTSVIQSSVFIDDSAAHARSFRRFPERRPSQSAPEAMDKDGIMYFGIMDPPRILCWNTATKFDQSNFHVIDDNRETLQFASGVKVVTRKFGIQELWVSTNRLPKYLLGNIDNTDTNYRLLKRPLSELLENSPCKKTQHHHSRDYRNQHRRPHNTDD